MTDSLQFRVIKPELWDLNSDEEKFGWGKLWYKNAQFWEMKSQFGEVKSELWKVNISQLWLLFLRITSLYTTIQIL